MKALYDGYILKTWVQCEFSKIGKRSLYASRRFIQGTPD